MPKSKFAIVLCILTMAGSRVGLGQSRASADEALVRTTSGQPARKVIVGTVLQPFWVAYPGLDKRLEQLAGIVDRLAAESMKKYGRGLDVVVLPETAVTGEMGGDLIAGAAPLAGALQETFARKAREHRCYIVVPTYLLEDREKKLVTNAAILIGRKGEVVGIYRKIHLAVPTGSDSMEGGTTPGKDAQVFQCDFGKLGIQICFDMDFDDSWQELERQGADLVVWPTQSPQTAQPAFRAMHGRYYIVSSTWRNNASVFEPTGRIAAQIREPQQTLVQEIDLSYALLPWSKNLAKGMALRKIYGEKVGYHYYEDEDVGIFWSNDPELTIGRMIQSIGVTELEPELRRIRKLYRKAGVPGS
jgi:predicted amidohydrolase